MRTPVLRRTPRRLPCAEPFAVDMLLATALPSIDSAHHMLERPLSPPEHEDAYRRHHLHSDGLHGSIMLAVATLGSTAFMRNDWILLGPSVAFTLLATTRVVFALFLIAMIVTLLRARNPKTLDQAISAALVAMIVMNIHVMSTRPPEYVGHHVPLLLIVNYLYIAAPGPIFARMVTAICLSVISFAFSWGASTTVLGNSGPIVAYVLANLVGLPLAIRMARLQRERFQAQLAEKEAYQKLAQEKERAEALALAKSNFLATMSHEFRTPMNAVLGLSEVLSLSELTSEQRDIVKTIHGSADGLLVLLNDILDHAKIDARRMTLEHSPVNIEELTKQVLATLRLRALEKRIALDLSVSTLPRYISGDPARIRQILVNLVSNAIKFTDAGNVSVRVDARPIDQERNEIRIQVEDTGAGISEKNLERIFSPFEQGHATLLGNRGGTGLGLTISRNLAELMGGSLTVRSTLGKGSTFEFTFPADNASAPEFTFTDQVNENAPIQPLRILVAEDNATNQRVAIAMLNQLGYEADVAGNGQIAVEKTAQSSYDIIFMDRHMPEVDGIEATTRIRALTTLEKRPHIIAMTASAFADDRAACLKAGMDTFLSKPIRMDDLSNALMRARTGQTVSTTTPAQDPTEPNLPILDLVPLEQLRALAGADDPHFLASLCTDFIRDSEERLDRFSSLFNAKDIKTFEREAHSMKSASASLGALRVSAICSKLERLANSGTLDGSSLLLGQLRVEFNVAREKLERELALGDSTSRA